MFGSSPIATFENTIFSNLEDKMKTLQKNQEEALVAHELARIQIITCIFEKLVNSTNERFQNILLKGL